ncbi:MAG: nuclear transport factor 2 family protein [Ferruginibacter sp.]
MKKIFTILFVCVSLLCQAQTEEEKLTQTLKEFHQALVSQNTVSINQQTDKALSYGHSNGWVQTKSDLIRDFESGLISYQRITEDSIRITLNGNMANVRFVSDVDATLKGNSASFHLKVLEVWVKKGRRWVLFGRQAVRG